MGLPSRSYLLERLRRRDQSACALIGAAAERSGHVRKCGRLGGRKRHKLDDGFSGRKAGNGGIDLALKIIDDGGGFRAERLHAR
jgi:hypothetical protein